MKILKIGCQNCNTYISKYNLKQIFRYFIKNRHFNLPLKATTLKKLLKSPKLSTITTSCYY